MVNSRFAPIACEETQRSGETGLLERRNGAPKSGPDCRGRPGRCAFTLIEVMLVLAVMVAIAAMAWPALQKPMAKRRVRAAADTVLTEWRQAQAEAMRTGHTYIFRYAIGGSEFRLGPQDAENASEKTPDKTTDAPPPAAVTRNDEKTLPEGIRFAADSAATDKSNGLADATSTAATPETNSGWSQPILFYPDNTTSNSRVVLTGDYGYSASITLRGATGTASLDNADVSGEQPP